MSLKPIETNYRGYRTRSRLEAKWMVFYDEVGLHFEYEPEGLIAGTTAYLPDFRLPELELFVEAKPALITFEPTVAANRNVEAEAKAAAIARGGSAIMVVYGDPVDAFGVLFLPGNAEALLYANFFRCPFCGRPFVAAGLHRSVLIRAEPAVCAVCAPVEDSLKPEAEQARRARFEHGERQTALPNLTR